MVEVIPQKYRKKKNRKRIHGQSWTPLPWELIGRESPISMGAAVLYSRLLDRSDENNSVEVSHKELSEMLGCSINSVKTYIKELEKQILLVSIQRKGEMSTYTVADILQDFRRMKK